MPGEIRPSGACQARRVRHSIRNPPTWRYSATQLRQAAQDLLQRQILAPKYITLPTPATLTRQQMPLGCVRNIHQVEPGIHEGRHVAFQIIYYDLAGGSRLKIVIADRRPRIPDYNRQTAARKLD